MEQPKVAVDPEMLKQVLSVLCKAHAQLVYDTAVCGFAAEDEFLAVEDMRDVLFVVTTEAQDVFGVFVPHLFCSDDTERTGETKEVWVFSLAVSGKKRDKCVQKRVAGSFCATTMNKPIFNVLAEGKDPNTACVKRRKRYYHECLYFLTVFVREIACDDKYVMDKYDDPAFECDEVEQVPCPYKVLIDLYRNSYDAILEIRQLFNEMPCFAPSLICGEVDFALEYLSRTEMMVKTTAMVSRIVALRLF